MNCLELRRKLLEDPFRREPELAEHESECKECAAFAHDLRIQETELRGLLQAVTTPPQLADNIELAIRLERRGRSRRQVWYAAAASVLLIVGATMASLMSESWERGNMALAQSVLNHIDDEAHHLREAHPLNETRVKFVFARFGAQLQQPIGPVNFAAECLMRKRNGVHLIIPGQQGPITVFFMPGEQTGKATPIRSKRFQGRILPTAWGSIAVVGERGESLDGIGERLAAAVRWPSAVLLGDSLPLTPLVAQQ